MMVSTGGVVSKKKRISPAFDGGDLSEVMMYEILPRLPIKQLFRLKLVCKRFNDSIPHDPLFISAYKSLNGSTSSFYFVFNGKVISTTEEYDSEFTDLTPRYVKDIVHVLGSTNGLLYGHCYLKKEIFVCNPVTKQFVLAPVPQRYSLRRSLALAVDPKHTHFGFRLIALYRFENPNCYEFGVYSSKTGVWQSSNAQVLLPSQHLSEVNGKVYTGGKVYWSLSTYILWFDVEQDIAGFLPCPPSDNLVCLRPSEGVWYSEMGVYKGDLTYTGITKQGNIEIWVLEKEEMWKMRHSVRLKQMVRENWDAMSSFCKLMQVRRRRHIAKAFARAIYPLPYLGGEVVSFWTKIEGIGKLFSINLRAGELKFVDDVRFPAIPFTPTFLPVPT